LTPALRLLKTIHCANPAGVRPLSIAHGALSSQPYVDNQE
jgi:hypothetical protein